MLRRPSEHPLSPSNIEVRGPDGVEGACGLTVESQTPMERIMSSQILIHTHEPRTSLAGSAPGTLARLVADGLLRFARRFMVALRESRQRQADQIIRQCRQLIDESND